MTQSGREKQASFRKWMDARRTVPQHRDVTGLMKARALNLDDPGTGTWIWDRRRSYFKMKPSMKTSEKEVCESSATSTSGGSTVEYPKVFDAWDIKKVIFSTIGNTCPSCGKRCASARGVSMHWQRKATKCQAARKCPDISLESASQAKFETVDAGKLEKMNSYNAYISQAKEIFKKFQHVLGTVARNSWARRMEDAVAQWYRTQDDFTLLLQPMKRLQRMMTKLSNQCYAPYISESFPDTDNDNDMVSTPCATPVRPLHEPSQHLVSSGTSLNTELTRRKGSTRLCNNSLGRVLSFT